MKKLLILPVTWMATMLVTLGVETSLPATADTWLRGTGGANDDNKNASEVLVGNINGSVVGRGVVEFDLSNYSLEAGDAITAARIQLVVSAKDASTTTNSGTLNLEARFVDDGGQAADLVNGATWINRSVSGPVPWTTPGGVYGASLIGSVGSNPFTVSASDVISISLTDLSGIVLGGKLQFGIQSPAAEALGGTRALYRFHSVESVVGNSVAPQLIIETSQPPLVGSLPPIGIGALNVSGTSTITGATTADHVQIGSGADGLLVIDGGDLTVTGGLNSGNSAPFRDGILEQIDGTVDVAGDVDFSQNAQSATVLRVWNPGQNSPLTVGGHLRLGRAVLTMLFDGSYVHAPGTPHTLLTYASRTGQFENVPADGVVSHGVNRFRIDYDVTVGDGLAITATALENYAQPASQPNLIFIMVDDQGYAELTPHGAAADRTPTLDILANQGLLCTSGYAVASVCSPTRGGLLTGRNCESVGHRQNIGGSQEGQGLSPVFRTHMQRLASVGYHNYWIGKWYAGTSAERNPLQRGVEKFYTISDGQSHTAGNDQLEENGVALGATTQYLTDHMGDAVVQYMSEHLATHPGEPFNIHWSDYAPHSPFKADPADLQALFGAKGSYATGEHIAAMNLAIDRNVGKVLDFLEDPDGNPGTDDSIAGNTLIVYTNDNGGTGAHNNGILRGSKGFQYEGGIRVPMIVRWPDRIAAGANLSHPAHQNDWIATFCSVAGVPNQERSELDGIDLMPILDGVEPYPVDRELFWNLWPRWIDAGERAGGMRKGDWKLIVSEDLSLTELYNLANDPGESTDVKAANSDNEAIHDAMFESYRKWQRTNVTPQWQESYNPNIITRDSGLYLRAIHNGYRLTQRNTTPLYYTTETRPFFDLTDDFELVVNLKPRSPEDVNPSSGAWLVFGFSDPAPTNVTSPPSPPDRAKLCRVGVDLGGSMLVLEDLNGAVASSMPMAAEWLAAEGAEVAVSYDGATRTLTATSRSATTSVVIPGGVEEWQHLGFGVASCEVEFSVLRDTQSRAGGSIRNLGFDGDDLWFDLEFEHPSSRPVQLEDSNDLQVFERLEDALIEQIAPGISRVRTTHDGSPRRFFRGVQ